MAATSHGIAHYLIVSKRLVAVVAAHLRAALPSVRLTPFPEYTTVEPTTAAELALSTTDRPLRTDQLAAVNAAILSSLQPLRAQEVATLQWVVSPTPVPLPVRIENRQQQRQTAEPWLWRALVARRSIETRDDLREHQAKQAEPLFAAVGRLAVSAADPQRSRHLLNRLSAAFHLLNAPGVQLRRRLLPGFLV